MGDLSPRHGTHGITESGEFDYSTHIDLGWLMIKIVNGHKSDHQKGLLGIADYLVFSSWRHWLWRSLEGSARNATSNSLPTRYFDQVNKNTSENECPSQKTDPSKNLSLKSQSLFKVGLCFCFFIINIRYLLNEQRTFCVVACKQITGKK